jgi:hypothetical protein
MNPMPNGSVFGSAQDKPKLRKIMTEPMSDADLEVYLPQAKILMFRELKNYPTIQSILRKPRDYFIMLYEHTPQNGHWVAVMRYESTIEFFCPYGSSPYSPNSPLEWNSPEQNQVVDATHNYLEDLLNNAKTQGWSVIYNKMDFQEKRNNINTCGAFCVWRVLCLMEDDMKLPEFQSAMKKIHTQTGMSYDEIVADAIEIRE